MKLVAPDDPILRTPTIPVDFSKITTEELMEISKGMTEIMIEKNGWGLAANQVGLSHSLFIMRSEKGSLVFINPKIVAYSNEMIDLEEGCISFPHIAPKIKRARHVRLRYQDLGGEVKTEQFINLTSRVVQHEILHLEGKCPFHDVSRLKLEMQMKKAKKFGLDYKIKDFM